MNKIFEKEITVNFKQGGLVMAQGLRRSETLLRDEGIVVGSGKMLSETLTRSEQVIIQNS